MGVVWLRRWCGQFRGGKAGLEDRGGDRGRVACRRVWRLKTRMQVAGDNLVRVAVEYANMKVDNGIRGRG